MNPIHRTPERDFATWIGQSGLDYGFSIHKYPPTETLGEGIYILTKLENHVWKPMDILQGNDSTCVSRVGRIAVMKNGDLGRATHFHFLAEPSEDRRLEIGQDLCERYRL